jgi:hypothetical protein
MIGELMNGENKPYWSGRGEFFAGNKRLFFLAVLLKVKIMASHTGVTSMFHLQSIHDFRKESFLFQITR